MIREREYDRLISKHLQSRARCSRCGEFGHTAKECTKSIQGELYRPIQDPTIAERFWKFVEKSDGCWLWTGGLFHDGYGQIWAKDKRYVRAHRASWLIHFGDIPDDMQVLHSCDVPRCVRPDHLFLGTTQDNAKDAAKKFRMSQGERHHKAKLTADQVRSIVLEYREGASMYSLAKQYGVSESAIASICHGQSWKALGLGIHIQTPGHSGVYRGQVAVRTIPTGVCGEDVVGAGNWLDKARKGHRVQSRNAMANKRPREANGRFSR